MTEPVPIDQQINCVGWHLQLIEATYPEYVKLGKMQQATADAELRDMRAVLKTLEFVARNREAFVEIVKAERRRAA